MKQDRLEEMRVGVKLLPRSDFLIRIHDAQFNPSAKSNSILPQYTHLLPCTPWHFVWTQKQVELCSCSGRTKPLSFPENAQKIWDTTDNKSSLLKKQDFNRGLRPASKKYVLFCCKQPIYLFLYLFFLSGGPVEAFFPAWPERPHEVTSLKSSPSRGMSITSGTWRRCTGVD